LNIVGWLVVGLRNCGRRFCDLKFGMHLTSTGNDKMAWRLRKKGKPRKKKK
jgi:site-specific DNA recombinase